MLNDKPFQTAQRGVVPQLPTEAEGLDKIFIQFIRPVKALNDNMIILQALLLF